MSIVSMTQPTPEKYIITREADAIEAEPQLGNNAE